MVQIDQQKICMTATIYNQVLVMIDHFTKYAEAAPCMTASAEKTCDHLINVWIARHGCPITFQSDNGKAFVGGLTKELMKRSQVAQTHSTTYHSQTNGLVERKNRTLVSMLRVYCSRYMVDWDRHLPQVMGAYNSLEHSTTGISPHLMLTGHEKALPLTFFNPEHEGKKTAPQTYVRDVIRRTRWYRPRDDMDKRRSCANCGSMDHHVSACSAYKQNMKAIGYFLDDVEAIHEDHEEYVGRLIMKYGPRCFFCNLEGHFKSDYIRFWDGVAIAKHPGHEEALSAVKAIRARLMNEAESRRKETTPSTFTTKKVKTLPNEAVASSLEAESAGPPKVDYGLAARTALQNVQQELATKEVKQWVRSALESTYLREKFDILGKTTKEEDKQGPRKPGLKLNDNSGKYFGMTKEGTKIMSIILVAGHQVVKNLSEQSEITLVHLDIPEGEGSQVGLQGSASAAHDRRPKANESRSTLH